MTRARHVPGPRTAVKRDMPLDTLPDLHQWALSIARQCAWLVLLLLIFLPLERLFAVRRRKFFQKGLAQDIGYFFISGLVPPLLLAVPLSLVTLAAYQTVPWRIQATVAAWPLWLRIVAGFAVGEVGFYWGHRWMHEIPFLWRFHSIHHSAEHVYFLTSARASARQRLHPAVRHDPCLHSRRRQPVDGRLRRGTDRHRCDVVGFFIHANVRWRLGPLERLIATPAFHHWHHARSALRTATTLRCCPSWT